MTNYREFLNRGTPNTYLESMDVQELEVLEKITSFSPEDITLHTEGNPILAAVGCA
ncbi:MAG: hypothetical protein IH795_08365, partial [Bacteroidetes bacterium]|nr:hypothetical protein [Bacteroidota bacterium]